MKMQLNFIRSIMHNMTVAEQLVIIKSIRLNRFAFSSLVDCYILVRTS